MSCRQSEDDDATDNPMTPEQIQSLLDRQIALTRELDEDAAPSPKSKERTISSVDSMAR